MKNIDVKVFPDASDLFQFAAKDFCQRAIAAVKDKDNFSVVLSGGTTPTLFFDVLAESEFYKNNIPWEKIQFYFGDERYVPPDSPESYYHMANAHLFSKLPVNPHNIFQISTRFSKPEDAANEYARVLQAHGDVKFDLVYLGLGDNAHTASLMPYCDVVKDYIHNSLADYDNQLVAALYVAELDMYRITLTPTALNQGKDIIFLVTGAAKAQAVCEVLNGKADALHYPAQLIHSLRGKTIWYLDQAAAAKLM
jgi:6-phosphogluconolactonase